MMKTLVLSVALAGTLLTMAQAAGSPIPAFTATALTGGKVSSDELVGQPTILIVTPSKDAAQDTRLWAQALRKNIDHKSIRIRDVLAIDLPFFMSEADAIGRAKEKIPARYHDQTWLFAKPDLEKALGIAPDSHKAVVMVLNTQGKIVTRVEGDPTEQRVSKVQSAVQSLR